MSKSKYKLPFVSYSIIKSFFNNKSKPFSYINIFSRSSIILPKFVGSTIKIYNGKDFKKKLVRREWVGYKFGEFFSSKIRPVYKGKKKR